MSAELIGILTVGVAIIAVVAVLFQRLDSRIDLLESRLEKRLDRLETGIVDMRERLYGEVMKWHYPTTCTGRFNTTGEARGRIFADS